MAGDILVVVDNEGVIVSASPGLEELGFDLPGMLLRPHLSDLAADSYIDTLRNYCDQLLSGQSRSSMIRFPVSIHGSKPRWYALRLRPMSDERGALGVIRSLDKQWALEDMLMISTLTDPLTGLPNSKALRVQLSDALTCGQDGSVVMIEIDHFRAVTLRFGPSTGDQVIAAIGQFLSQSNREGATIARLEGERFAAFLPNMDLMEALTWTQDLIATFATISADLGFERTRLSLSAGVARLSGTVDRSLSRAELGASVAKASGGSRAECGDWLHGCGTANAIEGRPNLAVAS